MQVEMGRHLLVNNFTQEFAMPMARHASTDNHPVKHV
jgi:hypothetical protein